MNHVAGGPVSPPPKPRVMAGTEIAPGQPAFSGFIFKIQANMAPSTAAAWPSSASAPADSSAT